MCGGDLEASFGVCLVDDRGKSYRDELCEYLQQLLMITIVGVFERMPLSRTLCVGGSYEMGQL